MTRKPRMKAQSIYARHPLATQQGLGMVLWLLFTEEGKAYMREKDKSRPGSARRGPARRGKEGRGKAGRSKARATTKGTR